LCDIVALSDHLGKIVSTAHGEGKKVFATEIQAEPWEPGQLVHLEKEPARSCSSCNMESCFNIVSSVDVDLSLMWGLEYWCYQEEAYRDGSWWGSVRDILTRTGGRTTAVPPRI
jgi:hypothetical protein